MKPAILDRHPAPPARRAESGATFIELMLAVLIAYYLYVTARTERRLGL